MRGICLVLLALSLGVVAGCGDGSDSMDGSDGAAQPTQTEPAPGEPAETQEEVAGTEVEVRDSEFGPMLFDSKGQAIYIFENDPKDKTVCYGECAAAWPPVFTDGEPQAGKGAKQALLGTVKRRDGKRQVTYAGQPLYFYAHEGRGEVRCHNVDLNGGFWWVVGANGKRRPA